MDDELNPVSFLINHEKEVVTVCELDSVYGTVQEEVYVTFQDIINLADYLMSIPQTQTQTK